MPKVMVVHLLAMKFLKMDKKLKTYRKTLTTNLLFRE
jgi:hypothetical protein